MILSPQIVDLDFLPMEIKTGGAHDKKEINGYVGQDVKRVRSFTNNYSISSKSHGLVQIDR